MGSRVIRSAHRGGIRRYFLERRGEAVRIARKERAGSVCKEFPLSRDRELYQLRRDGSQDFCDNSGNEKYGVLVVVAVPAKETNAEEYVGKHGNGACENDCDRHDEDVAIADVRKLVRNDAFKFAPIKPREKTCRYGNDRVFCVPSRRARARCTALDDI